MLVLFQLLLLGFVPDTHAELELCEIQTYADTVFISSGLKRSIIGSSEQSSSALRCLQRCSQRNMYRSFYFLAAAKECHCNTQLDKGATTTTQATSLLYGITYKPPQYLTFDRLHVLQELQKNRDCLSLYMEGYTKDGVYIIHPVGGVPVEAWCDMTGGGWTVVQRRQDGSENFYRGWDDYVKGFGNKTGEYWLGLEYMRIMTEEASTLKIELETFGDMTPSSAFAEYSSFKIGSSTSNYQLSVNGFGGDCGDSLVLENLRAFSTYDRDNDIHSTANCALSCQGAWWYAACHYSNLNGKYLGGHTASYANGINWWTCWDFYYSVKTSVMKIRRKFNC